MNVEMENARRRRSLIAYAVATLAFACSALVALQAKAVVRRVQEPEARHVVIAAPPPPPPPAPAVPPPPPTTARAPRQTQAPQAPPPPLGRAATPTTVPNEVVATAVAPQASDAPPGDPFGVEGGSGAGPATATPTPGPTGPIRLPENATRPVPLEQREPTFPDDIVASGIAQIRVTVRITLDVRGHVTRAEVLRGFAGLDNRVVERAIAAWTFEPARVDGEPVAVHFIQPITFQITR